MALVFEADTGSAFNKLALLALADHAADDGTSVYPSVPRLARKCDLSKRSAQRTLRHLEKAGFVAVEREGYGQSARRYRLIVEAIEAARRKPGGVTDSHPRGARLTPQEPGGVTDGHQTGDRLAPAAPGPVTDGHPTGDRLAPYPSVEPPRVKDEPPGEPTPTPSAADAASVSAAPIKAEILSTNGHRPVNGKPKKRKHREGGSPAFLQFWERYPKARKWDDTLTAWEEISPDAATCAAIFAGLDRYLASEDWAREGGRFIPHSTTWLHGGCWKDHPAPASGLSPKTAGNLGAGQRFLAKLQADQADDPYKHFPKRPVVER